MKIVNLPLCTCGVAYDRKLGYIYIYRKNPQHAFLLWGSKAVGPMS